MGASVVGRISFASICVATIFGGAAIILTAWYFSRPREPWQVDAGLEQDAIPLVETVGTGLYAITAASTGLALLSWLFLLGRFVGKKVRE
jgi:hypothetical protein